VFSGLTLIFVAWDLRWLCSSRQEGPRCAFHIPLVLADAGQSSTAPRAFLVGHHQAWTFAPDSLGNITDSAFRSAGAFRIRVWTGCASSHPTETTQTTATPTNVAKATSRRFVLVNVPSKVTIFEAVYLVVWPHKISLQNITEPM
jgi:hypothetical protein